MGKTFQILTLNKIAAVGLGRLPAARYVTGTEIAEPDAILVRSHNMLEMHIPKTVIAIARAGAGTNNVLVPAPARAMAITVLGMCISSMLCERTRIASGSAISVPVT